VLNTDDIDTATLQDVATDMLQVVGWDALGLGSPDREVKAIVGRHPEIKVLPRLSTEATEQGYWESGGQIFQAAVIPVNFGDQLIGLLYGGIALDDSKAAELSREIRAEVAIYAGDRISGTSLPRGPPRESLARALAAQLPARVKLGDEDFLTATIPLGQGATHAAILYSEEAALKPFRTLSRAVFWISIGALLAAVGLALIVATGISRPVADLTKLASAVANGNLAAQIKPSGGSELVRLGNTLNQMVRDLATSQEQLKRAEALKRELQIARNIQMSVLPHGLSLPDFEVAAMMNPAEEVGGDFYDIIPAGDHFWVLIGDVSGHGINAGLIMLMAQAAAHGALALNPDISPVELLSSVNQVIFENVRNRLQRDDYLTLMVAKYVGQGRFVSAGAHQPVFLARAKGTVELQHTEGPWCGLTINVKGSAVLQSFEMDRSDLLCLVTDGVLEAEGSTGSRFGPERVMNILATHVDRSANEVLAKLLGSLNEFTQKQVDDVTVVILKRRTANA
jgi:serine phosphatase RsbU (regulator of sigma subunit)